MNDGNINLSNEQERKAVVDAVRAVGAAWARYGLTVGRAALESSARSLQVTATALGQLAEAIENRNQAAREEKKDDGTIVVEPRG